MPKNFRQSAQTVDIAVNSVTEKLSGGYLRIYSGQQPESADDPITDQRLLVELRFSSPAFAPAVAGLAVMNPMPGKKVTAVGSGRASFFRAVTSSGETVFDGSVGLRGTESDLILTDIFFHAGVSRIPLDEDNVGASFQLPLR